MTKEPKVEVFYVRVVTAKRGAAGAMLWLYSTAEDIRFTTKRSAVDACEQLQEEFDADCDPKRAYVLDAQYVPVRAGGERRMSPMKGMA